MNNYVKYEYLKESMEFGTYDIMFPQTPMTKKVSIDFDADANLSTYFDQFIQFLSDVGFEEVEIYSYLKSICNYQHEVPLRVRQTKEKEVGDTESGVL
jgi:hypothetical protein|tara:strand:+ start:230 stop:523 length:294 start_codon:yes stop_codon:yes gene_type:complete